MPPKRIVIYGIGLFVVMTLALTRAQATTSPVCSGDKAKQAATDVEQLKDWNSVYRSFKRFEPCDEGTVAEQFSYSIGTLLAKEWSNLPSLLRLAALDPEFQQFVIRHIDENIPEEEAQRIVSNSRKRCPVGGEWLCKSVADY
jgi:hypothetical protein